MVDFNALRNAPKTTCPSCGNEFRNTAAEPDPDRDLCAGCQYLRDNPEEADKYWTWRRSGNHWRATASWPEREDPPEPGDRIDVHRRDGSSSRHNVKEILHIRVDSSGRRRVTVSVETETGR